MRNWREVARFCASASVSALAGRRVLNCLWELTYRCNARCSICAYWRRPRETASELTLGQIREGLAKIHSGGCRLVNFTGGEPTLRQDLEQIVESASRLGMWTSIVTNGSLLTRERLRALKGAGLDNLLISVDSADPANHDRQRGMDGSHAKAMERLRWLSDDFLSGHRTGGMMGAIAAGNLGEVPVLAALARAIGVYAVFQPYHGNKTGDVSPVPHIGVEELGGLLREKGRDAVILNSRRYLEGWMPERRPPCSAGVKYFCVDPLGYLHACVDAPPAGHILRDEMSSIRSAEAARWVEGCRGCWHCFRGEADTSLSASGYLEKVRLSVGVIWRNYSRRSDDGRMGVVCPSRS